MNLGLRAFSISAFSFQLLLSSLVYADHLPYNPSFPKASYPYFVAPDGCSSWNDSHPEYVRDDWLLFDFTGPCVQHDYCYMTLGSDRGNCDDQFKAHLHSVCESSGFLIQGTCVTLAEIFVGAVRAEGRDSYLNDQEQERKYLAYARQVIEDTFRTYTDLTIDEGLLQTYLELLKTQPFGAVESDIISRHGPAIVRKVFLNFTQLPILESEVGPLLQELRQYGYSSLPDRIVSIEGPSIISRIYLDVVGQPISDLDRLRFYTEYLAHKDTRKLRAHIEDYRPRPAPPPRPDCYLLSDPLEILRCLNG